MEVKSLCVLANMWFELYSPFAECAKPALVTVRRRKNPSVAKCGRGETQRYFFARKSGAGLMNAVTLKSLQSDNPALADGHSPRHVWIPGCAVYG